MKNAKGPFALVPVVLLTLLVAACGGDDDADTDAGHTASAVAGEEPCEPEGELNAILWEGYAPDESIKEFEEQYGVEMNVTAIASNDEVFDRIRTQSGQHDLVPATTDVTGQYIEAGLVQSLDLRQVPNAENVFGRFKDLEQASDDGEVYGVAHTWSADPIIYNADAIDDPESSYEALFNEDFAGRVALYDDLGSLWVGALVLGYDPFDLSEEEMNEVVDLMSEQRNLVRRYWSTGDDLVRLMASGEVEIATAWNYMYTQLKGEGVNVERLVPEEGNLGWVDTLMIPVNAENPCAAYKWMEWALSPEGGAQTAQASGYSIANPDVAEELSPQEVEDLHMDDPSFIDEIVLWEEVNRPMYQDAWNRVKN